VSIRGAERVQRDLTCRELARPVDAQEHRLARDLDRLAGAHDHLGLGRLAVVEQRLLAEVLDREATRLRRDHEVTA